MNQIEAQRIETEINRQMIDKVAKDGIKAQMFRYQKEGRRMKYSMVEIDGELFWVRGTVETQLYNHLGLGMRELEGVMDYTVRNEKIQNAVKGLENPLVFRTGTDEEGKKRIYAVVTPKFTHVGHNEVFALTEEQLKLLGIENWEGEIIATPTKVYKTYEFPKMTMEPQKGDIINCGIRVSNSVKGLGGVAAFGFYKRLVCSNGMTSQHGIFAGSRKHVGIADFIKLEIKEMITSIISKIDISDKINQARQERLDITAIDGILYNLSIPQKYSKETIEIFKKGYPDNNTRWDLVNALTYVSSHSVERDRRRLEIEQIAFYLLETPAVFIPNKEPKVTENPMVVKMR